MAFSRRSIRKGQEMALLLRPLSIGEMLDRTFSIYDERVRKEALDMQFMMATIDRGAVAGAAAAAGVPPSV